MNLTHTRRLSLFVSATVAVMSLAACQKPAQTAAVDPNALPLGALPLNQAPPPGYAAPAPTPSALPPAPLARFAPAPRNQRYRYVERAAAMNDAFAQSPPDYAIDYQGTRPWVWRAHNGAYRVAEQVPGGERYYYYDRGVSEPYLIRDPQYTYAYDQGQFVEMYDGYGRPLSPDVAAAQAAYAGRYLYYARQLYLAARDNRREAAYAANWQARQSAEFAQHQQWRDEQQRDAEWRDWHDQNDQREQAVWRDDRSQRQGYSAGTVAAAAGAAGVAGWLLGSQHHPHDGQPYANSDQQAQAVALARQQQAQSDLARQQQAAMVARGQQAQSDQMAQQQAARQAQIAAQAHQQQAQSDLARQQQERQQAAQQQTARQQQLQAEQGRQQAVQQQAAFYLAQAQARKAVPEPVAVKPDEAPRREAMRTAAKERDAAGQPKQ